MLLVIIGLFGVFGGIYTNDKIISLPEARAWVVVALSQLIFFVIIKWIVEFSLQMLHVGLNIALERRINSLVKHDVLLWDSVVSPSFIAKPRSGIFFASVLLIILGFACFAVIGWLVSQQPDFSWFVWAVIVETVVVVCLLYVSLTDASRVERACWARLSCDAHPDEDLTRTSGCQQEGTGGA